MPAKAVTDADKPVPAPKPKPRPKATMGFSCGGGPCKAFNIYENEPELPKLPAPAEVPPAK